MQPKNSIRTFDSEETAGAKSLTNSRDPDPDPATATVDQRPLTAIISFQDVYPENHNSADQPPNELLAGDGPPHDHNLPVRLFATDRFPQGRLNVYSRPDYLSFVHDQLKGTPEWKDIKTSSFGQLFNFTVSRCPISCKLVHSLLTRELVTKKKYELWTVYAGQPLKFSLAEFSALTGLNCSEFPEGYDFKYQPKQKLGERSAWETFIGPNKKATLVDVANLLRNRENMPSWRIIGLALLLIIDGVLIANYQGDGRPTPKYVELLLKPNAFMHFPWGRESFLKTVSSMKPSRKTPGTDDDPVQLFRQQLQQKTYSLKGFPLVLQMLAFKHIPMLEARLPFFEDNGTILEATFPDHPKNATITQKDVLNVEFHHELKVIPMMLQVDANTEWDDEVKDKKVEYLEKRITHGHCFQKHEWPGGDKTLDLYVHPGVPQERILPKRRGKEHVTISQPLNPSENMPQKYPSKKQRHIDSYFKAPQGNEGDHKLWTEQKIKELNSYWLLKLEEINKRWAKRYRMLSSRLSRVENHQRMQRTGGYGKFAKRNSLYSWKKSNNSNKTVFNTPPTDGRIEGVDSQDDIFWCNYDKALPGYGNINHFEQTTKDVVEGIPDVSEVVCLYNPTIDENQQNSHSSAGDKGTNQEANLSIVLTKPCCTTTERDNHTKDLSGLHPIMPNGPPKHVVGGVRDGDERVYIENATINGNQRQSYPTEGGDGTLGGDHLAIVNLKAGIDTVLQNNPLEDKTSTRHLNDETMLEVNISRLLQVTPTVVENPHNGREDNSALSTPTLPPPTGVQLTADIGAQANQAYRNDRHVNEEPTHGKDDLHQVNQLEETDINKITQEFRSSSDLQAPNQVITSTTHIDHDATLGVHISGVLQVSTNIADKQQNGGEDNSEVSRTPDTLLSPIGVQLTACLSTETDIPQAITVPTPTEHQFNADFGGADKLQQATEEVECRCQATIEQQTLLPTDATPITNLHDEITLGVSAKEPGEQATEKTNGAQVNACPTNPPPSTTGVQLHADIGGKDKLQQVNNKGEEAHISQFRHGEEDAIKNIPKAVLVTTTQLPRRTSAAKQNKKPAKEGVNKRKANQTTWGSESVSTASEAGEISDSCHSQPNKKQNTFPCPFEEMLVNTLTPNRLPVDVITYEVLQCHMLNNPEKLHLTKNKTAFTNKFLLELGTPMHMVKQLHMEVLCRMLGYQHSLILKKERSRFVSPQFINHVLDRSRHFLAAKDKTMVRWSRAIKDYVSNPTGEWIEHIDTIYIPMLLGDNHWVGLVINLRLWFIEVLDPNCTLMEDDLLDVAMVPLSNSLPYILKSCCRTRNAVNIGLKPFDVQRTSGLYCNSRQGDSGPVSVKFMELRALGNPQESMSNLTDGLVDQFRKQYVIDICLHYLLPLYAHKYMPR